MEEVWRDVVGYEGKYMVSNRGNIKGLNHIYTDVRGNRYVRKEKLLEVSASHGYLVVNLLAKTHRVHRIVAEAFIPNPNELPNINHKNSSRHDNHVDNLEWCSQDENVRHSIEEGTSAVIHQRKKVAQYTLEGEFIREWESLHEAAGAMGDAKQHGNLRKCCQGKRNSFRGYAWKFVNEGATTS